MIDFVENAERRRGPELLAALAEEAHGKRIHGVAGVDGDRNAGTTMHRGHAAPGVAAVLDVVVHEEGVVQHLDAGGGGQRVLRPTAQRARRRDAQRRPQALARAVDEVLHQRVQVRLRLRVGTPAASVSVKHVAVPGEPLEEPPGPTLSPTPGTRADYHRARVRVAHRPSRSSPSRRGAKARLRRAQSPLAQLERVRRTAHERRDVARSSGRTWSSSGDAPRRACGRDLRERIVPGQPGPVARRVVQPPRRQDLEFLQRPDLAARAGEFDGVEQSVHRPPRRLVGAFHRREVGVRAHVVGRQEQVRNGGRRLGPQRPGVDDS